MLDFKCTIKRERFNSENFKIYVVDVDKKLYPQLASNKNGEYIIVGDIQNLIPHAEYKVKASLEINKNFGAQYKATSATKDKSTDLNSSKTFLCEIGINVNSVDILLKVYPNIIDKIIKNDLSDVDLNLTKGIKDATFDRIKGKVIENFALIEVVNLFKGLISINVIKKLYEKYKSVTKIKKELCNNPYRCLCKLNRIGFRTADKILLELDKNDKEDNDFKFAEKLLISKQRMKACVNFILEENESEGNTKISIKELRTECNLLTPECITHFVTIIKENDEDIYVNKKTKEMAIMSTYNTENYIANTLTSMLKNSYDFNMQTELYREDNGFILTDEQLKALDNVCKYNVSILTAPAGSGKTASVKNLLTMLDEDKKTYMLCSPTGKASEVMQEQTGRKSGTIHRQLHYNPANDNPWTFNEKNKLDVDMVVVDEFSMVDVFLFKHLLDAIDATKTKLLLVFDSYQLCSVGCGNIAQNLLTSEVIPITRLTKIFRYAEGGLMQVVTKIRNGDKFLDNEFNGVKICGTSKDFIFVELQQQKIIHQLIKIYNKLLTDKYSTNDIMVLSSQNKGEYGTKAVNKEVQKIIQKRKDNKFLLRGEDKFYKDDKVMQMENNYKASIPEYLKSKIKKISPMTGKVEEETTEVFNGNTGIICDVGYNDMTVNFGKGKYVVYTKDKLNQLELGYCISIHKSQGDSSKQVICIAPKSHTFMLNSNLLYVAGTRAKERVYMLGNIITVNRSIKKKENLERSTWLVDLLKTAWI